jgi:hypothetical protein
MLCYAISCYAILCYTILCYDILRYAMLYQHAMLLPLGAIRPRLLWQQGGGGENP